jgi:hypothetical protein
MRKLVQSTERTVRLVFPASFLKVSSCGPGVCTWPACPALITRSQSSRFAAVSNIWKYENHSISCQPLSLSCPVLITSVQTRRHCCLGWFRWQLRQHEAFLADVRRPKRVEGDPNQSADDFVLQCPVCRTSVDSEDLDRLRSLTAKDMSEVSSDLLLSTFMC